MTAPAELRTPGALLASTPRLLLAGELDLATVPALADELEAACPDGGSLDLDASGVTFLDCAALGWLVRTLRRPGVRLVATSRAVSRLASVAGIAPLVAVDTGAVDTRDVDIRDVDLGPTVSDDGAATEQAGASA